MDKAKDKPDVKPNDALKAVAFAFALALAACGPAPAPAEKTAPAPAPAAASAQGRAIAFQSPTGNIGCDYTPAGGTAVYSTPDGAAELKCDRVEPAYVRITLPEHGAATVLNHVGDAGCCGGELVGYGQEWNAGPFSCSMSEAGLTCESRERHGFTLSRDSAQTH